MSGSMANTVVTTTNTTTTPADPGSATNKMKELGALLISGWVALIYTLCLIGAIFFLQDSTLTTTLFQTTITLFTLVVGYWVGSSDGSSKKSETINKIAGSP